MPHYAISLAIALPLSFDYFRHFTPFIFFADDFIEIDRWCRRWYADDALFHTFSIADAAISMPPLIPLLSSRHWWFSPRHYFRLPPLPPAPPLLPPGFCRWLIRLAPRYDLPRLPYCVAAADWLIFRRFSYFIASFRHYFIDISLPHFHAISMPLLFHFFRYCFHYCHIDCCCATFSPLSFVFVTPLIIVISLRHCRLLYCTLSLLIFIFAIFIFDIDYYFH